MKALFDKFSDMPPKAKQKAVMYTVAALFIFGLLLTSLVVDNHQEARERPARASEDILGSIVIGQGGADLDDSRIRVRMAQYERQLEQSQDQIRGLINQVESLLENNQASSGEVDRLTRELDAVTEERQALVEVIQELSRSSIRTQQEIRELENAFIESLHERDLRAEQPAMGRSERMQQEDSSPPQINERSIHTRSLTPEEAVRTEAGENIFDRRPNTDSTTTQAGSSGGTSSGAAPRIVTLVDQNASMRREEEVRALAEHYLTPGSILTGVLITGLDAPTSAGARRDTTPALIRIQDTALMANLWQMDIRECMALVSGYGSISDERAHLSGDVLTCITDDGDVIEASLPGYVTGTDGSIGIRGRAVFNSNTMIRRATFAAFSEALSDVFGAAFTQVPDGINSADDLANITAAAGAAGMSNSFSRLADYWIEMAETMSPVIEVKAGVPVHFITTRGVDLEAARSSNSRSTSSALSGGPDT